MDLVDWVLQSVENNYNQGIRNNTTQHNTGNKKMLTGIELLKRLSNGQLPFGIVEEDRSGHGRCVAIGGFSASYSYDMEWDENGNISAKVTSFVYFDPKGRVIG